MGIPKLTQNEIDLLQNTLKGWIISTKSIKKEFNFIDFKEAFAFMTKVALISESMNHHPKWQNIYNVVIIELSTHDIGGLSALDINLAKEIDNTISSQKI